MSPARRRRGKSRFNGPRGAGLFCVGVVCLLRGLFLLHSDTPLAAPASGMEALTAGWRPAILVYTVAWAAAGISAMVCAFRVRDALACAAVFGLCAVWGIGYLVAGIRVWLPVADWDAAWWGLDHARREWSAAASSLGIALLGGYWSRMVNPSRLQANAQREDA